MDHEWAAQQLRQFKNSIDSLSDFTDDGAYVGDDAATEQLQTTYQDAIDYLVTVEPVMRLLIEAALPGMTDYPDPRVLGYNEHDATYWQDLFKRYVLRAIGIHTLGVEAHKRMRPDSPDLLADRLHPWVWDAAAPLWYAGSTQEAILAAARSVNARLQQKLGRHDRSESALCREAFSPKDPAPGCPRLRFPGDRTADTWRSRQQGGVDFGAGCFEGIRNPVAHEDGLDIPEQIALEQLAAFSVLARWIDECTVETAT